MLCVHSIDADTYAYEQGLEEIKWQAIEEKYQKIQISEEELISILTKHFGYSIDCCAVVKAKEDNYGLFIRLSDVLGEFVYEVTLKHFES